MNSWSFDTRMCSRSRPIVKRPGHLSGPSLALLAFVFVDCTTAKLRQHSIGWADPRKVLLAADHRTTCSAGRWRQVAGRHNHIHYHHWMRFTSTSNLPLKIRYFSDLCRFWFSLVNLFMARFYKRIQTGYKAPPVRAILKRDPYDCRNGTGRGVGAIIR